MGNLKRFIDKAVSDQATVLLDGAGDSTYRFAYYGISAAIGRALLECTTLGWKGYMGGDNLLSSAGAPDGYVNAIPRRVVSGTYMGTTDNPPAGCTGVPFLAGCGPLTTLTTVGGITNVFTGAVTVGGVTDEWWPDGSAGHIIFLDTGEVVACSNKAGTTITLATRAQFGTTAAAHAQGASVACVTSSAGNNAPWLTWIHGLLGAAATYNNSAAGIQCPNTSPIGTQGSLEFVWFGENPTGSVVGGAQHKLSLYSVDNPAGPTDTLRANLAAGSTINPTTSDAAGTLLAVAQYAPSGLRTSNTQPTSAGGVWADNHASLNTVGNYLGVRKVLHNRTRKGGIVQSHTASRGGSTLREFVACALRTPRWISSQVRKTQCARYISSAARGGNSTFRSVFATAFMRNDTIDSHLGFVVAGYDWTIDTTKSTNLTASYNGSDTTFNVSSTANLPTSGHGYNPTTGERFTWSNKTGSTLTGIFRGDFGTSATASTGTNDALQFGYEHHRATGFVSTLLMWHLQLRTIHNAADISQANVTYPFATSGTYNMLAADTGVPDAPNELMHVLIAGMPVSSAPVAGAGAASTRHEREYFERECVRLARQYLGGFPDFVVLDPRDSITVEDVLKSGFASGLAANTTLASQLNTGDATASLNGTFAGSAGTDSYLFVDGEIIEYSAISGGGPYTYTLRTRNVGGQSSALATHTAGSSVGVVDLIHTNPNGHDMALCLIVKNAVEPSPRLLGIGGSF